MGSAGSIRPKRRTTLVGDVGSELDRYNSEIADLSQTRIEIKEVVVGYTADVNNYRRDVQHITDRSKTVLLL